MMTYQREDGVRPAGNHSNRLIAGILCLSVFILQVLITASQAQEQQYLDGRALLQIGRTEVSFQGGVEGIVFDTTGNADSHDTIPDWRFLGRCKVDSLVFLDSVVAVADEGQMASVQITSEELLKVIEYSNTRLLRRAFRGVAPDLDTEWDPVTQEWSGIPDLSTHYELHFGVDVDADSVVARLQEVPGMMTCTKWPVPHIPPAVE